MENGPRCAAGAVFPLREGTAMRVVRLHSDWESALGGSRLEVRGSFRRVLNVELPIAVHEGAADEAGGEAVTAWCDGGRAQGIMQRRVDVNDAAVDRDPHVPFRPWRNAS